MKYYIIAGEASGDLHGSNLMKALKNVDPYAQFRFWGGDLMKAVSPEIVKHYKEMAFMGFWEVLVNLRFILKNMRFCKHDIAHYNPNVVIFIDYPGFNLNIAKWAKRQGFKTHYYISPQIWAWKENRIKAIKRDIDTMCVILPFEKKFYESKHHYPVHFVGHPLLDAISESKAIDPEAFRHLHLSSKKPVIALLPGSRKQEIKRILPVMLRIVSLFPEYEFVIAGSPGQEASFYKTFIKDSPVTFVHDKTYELLSVAHAALVTSGTATLETALFRVPEVVCYKASTVSYQIAKFLIKQRYISLVNLIVDKEIVTELIQNNLNAYNLKRELEKLLNPEHRKALLSDYNYLREQLKGAGASENVANTVINLAKL